MKNAGCKRAVEIQFSGLSALACYNRERVETGAELANPPFIIGRRGIRGGQCTDFS